MNYNLVTILGHTAGGKTSLAASVAAAIGGEIISADSRQVYRGMDIGTGKDYSDYRVGETEVPCHLIDIVDAGGEYNLFQFKKDFTEVFHRIASSGKVPVMCGGTGLYLEAVLRNYTLPEVPVNRALRSELETYSSDALEKRLKSYGPLHNTTDLDTRKRTIRAIEIAEFRRTNEVFSGSWPQITPLVAGLRFERDERRARITRRLKERLANGMTEEVERLMKEGLSVEKLEYYGLEYKYIARYLTGMLTYEEMFSRLNTAIHRFAKRQMTYFRGMEKRGVEIRWLQGERGPEQNLAQILEWYTAT